MWIVIGLGVIVVLLGTLTLIDSLHNKTSNWIFNLKTREYLTRFVPVWYPLYHQLFKKKQSLSYVGILDKSIAMQLKADEKEHKFAIVFLGTNPAIVVTDPKVVQSIYYNWQTYLVNCSLIRPNLSAWLGRNIFSANGEDWKRQSEVVAPAFARSEIYYREIFNIALDCLQVIDKLPSQNTSADVKKRVRVADLMDRFAMDALGRTIWNYEFNQLGSESNTYAESLRHLQRCSTTPLSSVLSMMLARFGVQQNDKSLPAHCQNLDTLAKQMIAKTFERKESEESLPCIIDQMVQAADEDADNLEGISETELRNNCLALLLEMHQMIASSTGFALYYLAKHPEIQEYIYHEIQDNMPLEILAWTYEMLRDLEYTNLFITENFRLHPPMLQDTRVLAIEQKFGDLLIPEGATVYIPSFLMHRNKLTWGDDVNECNPSRFIGIQTGNIRKRLSYMPFGYGPRMFSGSEVVEMHVIVLLALITRNYAIDFASPKDAGNDVPYNSSSYGYSLSNDFDLIFTKRIQSYQM